MADMDTATLEAHIAVIKRATEAGRESGEGEWDGRDFSGPQEAYDPSEVDHAIAAILNAVADGALVPASTVAAQAAQIKLLREALTRARGYINGPGVDRVNPLLREIDAALQSEVSHG